MTKERREKELQKVHEQLAALQEKAKRLESEKKQADDAEKMKIIEKNKISIDLLIKMSQISEQEIEELLKRKRELESLQIKEKEASSHEKNETIN